MNQKDKLMRLSFIIFYIIGTLYLTNSIYAEVDVLPGVSGNGPTFDGNITSSEWAESVKFDVDFNNGANSENGTILVQANGTHIFVGFNYTSTQQFVPVNDFVEVDSITPYNNATHNWLALQFDNNLDGSEIGSSGSPDDVIVVDQYNSTVYDGIANGNVTYPFLFDTSINGTENSFAVRTNYTDNSITTTGYEFVKPLNGVDKNGSDFNLFQSKIMQFKLAYWMNQTANATLNQGQSSVWFKVMINETGTGLATKIANELHIQLVVDEDDRSDYSALETVLVDYGYNITSVVGSNFTIDEEADLLFVIVSQNGAIPQPNQGDLQYFLKLGGKAMIFLSSKSTATSNALSDAFNLDFLSNPVQVPGSEINSTLQSFDAQNMSDLDLFSSTSLITDQVVSTLEHTGGAFNVSNLNDNSMHPYTLSQEYYGYNLFGSTTMTYDANNNELVDEDETGNGLSLGVAFDFVKGGRVSLFPSEKIIQNDHIINSNNIPLILKLIPWTSGIVEKVQVESTSINKHNLVVGGSVSITLNMTDVFGDALQSDQTANISIHVKQAGKVVSQLQIVTTGTSHTESMTINKVGFITIRTIVFIYGSGFSEGEILNLHVDNDLPPLNDLNEMNFLMFTFFLISLALALFVYLKSKK